MSPASSPAALAAQRRIVRRDSSISDGAARLFSEIVDLHMLDGGCYANDTKLGAWIGCTERTIRRRRKQLVAAGYLDEENREGRRYLVPVADADTSVRTPVSDASVRMDSNDGQQRPSNASTADNSVRERPDNSVQDQELVIPAEHERARAREDDPPPVKVFVETVGRRPSDYEYDRIQSVVTGAWDTIFRECCQESIDNVGGDPNRVALGILLKQYRKEIRRRREKRKQGRRWTSYGSGMTDLGKLARQLDGLEPLNHDSSAPDAAYAHA